MRRHSRFARGSWADANGRSEPPLPRKLKTQPCAGFFVPAIHSFDVRFAPNCVEKLCFSAARKFKGIFQLPGAQVSDQLCASESRQAEFSCDFYYPLVSTVRIAAQIANEIATLFKTEFFNSIPPIAAFEMIEF